MSALPVENSRPGIGPGHDSQGPRKFRSFYRGRASETPQAVTQRPIFLPRWVVTTNFTLTESGMFSAGSYDEQRQVLTVTFRTSGDSYAVPGVSKAEGSEFMTSMGKSALWPNLKAKGPYRV